MKSILIEIVPYDPVAGERVTALIGDGHSSTSFGLGGLEWEPALKSRPRLSSEICSPTLDGKLKTGDCSFSINLNEIQSLPNATKLYWRGADVTIWSVNDDDYSARAIEHSGRVVAAVLSADSDILNIQSQVASQFIEKPLLTADFSGLGGINGAIGLRGKLRPAGFGANENIPPVWFDLINNIGQIDGYGNTISIDRLMEGASSMGAALADFPTYAALRDAIIANEIPPGAWATCVADGLVGLGAPPAGVITVNAIFGANRAGAIIKRVLEIHAAVDPERIDQASLIALDVSVPRAVHYWTADQRSVKDLVEALAGGANASPIITMQGKIVLSRGVPSEPVATLHRQGQVAPYVKKWVTAETQPPTYRMKARAARPAAVLSIEQVYFTDDLVEVGAYLPTETYRAGNIVTLSNGSRWLYISDVPKAGEEPGDSNPNWQRLANAITAGNITYEDGTSVEALKPAEPGSDVTGDHTSADTAAVAGRPAATVNGLTDLNAVNIIEQALRLDDAQIVVDARTFVEGQPISTVFVTFRNEQTDQNSAVNSILTLLGAKTTDGTAWVLDLSTVRVDPATTMAQKFTEIGAANEAVEASVTSLQEVVLGPDGEEARSLVKARVNDNAAMLVVGATGAESAIGLQADNTVILSEDGTTVLATFGADVDGAYIPNLKVDTLKIGTRGSTNGGQVVTSATAISGTGNANFITLISDTVTLDAPGTITASACIAQSFPSGDDTWNIRLRIDGNEVFAAGGQKTQDVAAVSGALYLPAGTYTVDVRWAAPSAVSNHGKTLNTAVLY